LCLGNAMALYVADMKTDFHKQTMWNEKDFYLRIEPVTFQKPSEMMGFAVNVYLVVCVVFILCTWVICPSLNKWLSTEWQIWSLFQEDGRKKF
jgi:hypothetical protein